MPRWQALLALLAVGTGSVLTAAGPTGLTRLGTVLLDNAGWILIGLGALALLSAIAPRGALLGPLILILAGLVVIGWPQPEIWTLSGSVITVGGGLLLMRKSTPHTSGDDPVMHRWIAGFAGRVPVPSPCPERIFLKGVVGQLTVNFFDIRRPQTRIVEVLITCWGGSVKLHVPQEWAVVGGRLAAATLISFSGTLDSKKQVHDRSSVNDTTFAELTQGAPALVIVHVMGVGGNVDLRRQVP